MSDLTGYTDQFSCVMVLIILPFFFGVLVPFSDVVEPLSLFSLEESSPPESLLDWFPVDEV